MNKLFDVRILRVCGQHHLMRELLLGVRALSAYGLTLAGARFARSCLA